jgi:hypothetical protein
MIRGLNPLGCGFDEGHDEVRLTGIRLKRCAINEIKETYIKPISKLQNNGCYLGIKTSASTLHGIV